MTEIRLKRHYVTLPELFQSLSSLSSSRQQVAHYQETLNQNSARIKRVVQLITEDIILEITSIMSEEIVSHMVHTFRLASQLNQEYLMNFTKTEEEKSKKAEKKSNLIPFLNQYQSERDKSNFGVWFHRQRLSEYNP